MPCIPIAATRCETGAAFMRSRRGNNNNTSLTISRLMVTTSLMPGGSTIDILVVDIRHAGIARP